MARKQKTFMDKIAKGTGPRGEKCPKCGEVIQPVMMFRPYRSAKGTWRYKRTMVRVCKCNAKEVLVDTPEA